MNLAFDITQIKWLLVLWPCTKYKMTSEHGATVSKQVSQVSWAGRDVPEASIVQCRLEVALIVTVMSWYLAVKYKHDVVWPKYYLEWLQLVCALVNKSCLRHSVCMCVCMYWSIQVLCPKNFSSVVSCILCL